MGGENSYIGSYSTIQLTHGMKVFIGNDTAISHNVRICTSEDLEIKTVVENYGGEVPFLRPMELAQDNSNILIASYMR